MLDGPGMKAQEIANLAWALAVMGDSIAETALLRDLLTSAQAQRLDLGLIESHQLYQVHRRVACGVVNGGTIRGNGCDGQVHFRGLRWRRICWCCPAGSGGCKRPRRMLVEMLRESPACLPLKKEYVLFAPSSALNIYYMR